MNSKIYCCFCGEEVQVGPTISEKDPCHLVFVECVTRHGFPQKQRKEEEFYCHASCVQAHIHQSIPVRLFEHDYPTVEEENWEEAVGEAWQEFTNQLATEATYTFFLERLFSLDPNVWHRVIQLCQGIDEAQTFFSLAEGYDPADLLVLYTDEPGHKNMQWTRKIIFTFSGDIWFNIVLKGHLKANKEERSEAS
jgi:hypothetical protein